MGIVNFSNMTTPQAFLDAPNVTTGGWFWTSCLLMFTVVMFLSTVGMGMEVALMASLFAGLLVGILLLYAGLISPLWLGVMVGGLILSFLISYMKSPRNN